jgi:hypothetical protein
MQRRSNVATGVVFILVMVLHALTVSTAHGQTLSIAQARQQPLGTVVSVQGWVTVPNVPLCIFQSFSFDCGFAMQDNSAGIYVHVPVTPPPSSLLALNKKVQVTGCLQDSFGLLILSTDPADCPEESVTVLSSIKLINPQEFTTCQIGENTEGRLVRVVGTVTEPSELDQGEDEHIFGYRVRIDSNPHPGNPGRCDDGSSGELQVFISVDAQINPFDPQFSFIQIGNQIEVKGFSGQFDDHYEVNPRFKTDINPAP